ncbi:acyl-CoA dehydrogenase family protein [Pseudophaeobacter sp.]|jgi:alkylation response protein AidB-like acyl-CoA dehydrogenase|uniref:acyl-CoA dehydrogenase family protein n=1 Tax=Pseudophaeobacter sp. TaxID=1971739 RepID=UPI0032D8C433
MAKLIQTEEETLLSEAAHGLLSKSATVSRLREMRDSGEHSDPALWQEMAAAGWAGVLVPESAEGSDMGHAAAHVLAREMGRNLTVSPFLSTAVMAATLLRQFSDDSATSKLKQIAVGGLTYALALDETAKFSPDQVELTAESRGNGYVLNGKKRFVVDGCDADRILVLAKSDAGLCLFDLANKAQGLTQNALKMIDSRDAADLIFNDVEVSGEALLGDPGAGFDVLKPALEAGQAALAAETTGLAEAAFSLTTDYLKERKQFGITIGSFQALQHRAAHLWCEIELTHSAVLNAGRILDETPDQATLAVSVAKARATDTAQKSVQEGVQMHGGIGMTDEFDMGFYMKRARVAAEWLGDYGYHAGLVAQLRGF